MNNELVTEIATALGYERKGYGLVKQTDFNTHWISLVGTTQIQMYGYLSDDDEFEKIYDTGIMHTFNEAQLQHMLSAFIANHD